MSVLKGGLNMNSNVYYKCVAYDDGFETKEGTRIHKCLFVSEDCKDWLEKYYQAEDLPIINGTYQVEFELFHGKTRLKLTQVV